MRPAQYRWHYFSTPRRPWLYRNTIRGRMFKFVGTTQFKTTHVSVQRPWQRYGRSIDDKQCKCCTTGNCLCKYF